MAARKRKSTGTGRKKAPAKRGKPVAAKKAARPSRRAPEPLHAQGSSEASILAKLPEGKLYYRIGEVSEITEIKPHVLRYWETEFRWMAPPKSRSKQRLYRRKDIEMILAIKRLLYEERYTIAGARQQLSELGLGGAADAAEAPTPARKAASTEELNAEVLASELRATYQRLRGEIQEIRDLL